jgi:hypothetical protein
MDGTSVYTDAFTRPRGREKIIIIKKKIPQINPCGRDQRPYGRSDLPTR